VTGAIRLRREPPPFRHVTLVGREVLSPRLVRLTLGGPQLDGLDPGLPAASVRLLLPRPDGLELPAWNGNEFRHTDGTRPALRTLTPLALDPVAHELEVEVVLHGEGPLSTWAADAPPGAQAAVSGTGRGYAVDAEAPAFLLAGDESAIPAIRTLLPALPATAALTVLIELAHADARVDLPAAVTWLDLPDGAPPGAALVAAVGEADIPAAARVWVAGEAASVQRIRTHLFDERGLPRSQCAVRGYWKHGRAAET
jgi:NADPH-dependent ferric siderophore reductase